MAENIGTQIRRDTALEKRMLEAVIAERNAQPRNQQVQIGPSEVGGCRELLRAGLFEPETMSEPETHWATAAHVGSIMGADLEAIFGRRLNALEQQRVTAQFDMLGVSISGAIDLLFLDEGQVTDLKSTDDIGGVLYDLKKNAAAIETLLSIWREGLLFQKRVETPDGGYEMTEKMVASMSKLHYYVQVAIYVHGAMQLGILDEGAEGRLAFYDRSGSFQEFVALVLTNEELRLFFEIGQHRLAQVVSAQEGYEKSGGQQVVIAHLRDMTPSYCFSPKVMCPRRMHCWGGSDWTTDERISAEHAKAVERYIMGREMAKLGDGMKKSARAELDGVSGMLPDGRMVTWVRGGTTINIVETTANEPKPTGEVLDHALDVLQAEETRERTPAELRADRERILKGLRKPQLTLIATGYDPDVKGTIPVLIDFILDQEFQYDGEQKPEIPVEQAEIPDYPGGYVDDLPPQSGPEFADPEPDEGAYLRPDEAEAQALLDGQPEPESTMIWVGDMSFRCECGTNTFTRVGEDEYRCNGCATRYNGTGERADQTLATDEEMEQFSDQVEERVAEVTKVAQQYEEEEILLRRQELFGLPFDELRALAEKRGVAPDVPRNFAIQAILDAEFKPKPGRGWAPNGAGTSGDPSTDRLRQMQYNADPAMRASHEGEKQ